MAAPEQSCSAKTASPEENLLRKNRSAVSLPFLLVF